MKIYKIVMPALLLIVLQSCIDLGIYVSDYPLAPASSSDPVPGIIGIWHKIPDNNEESGIDSLEFILFNKNEYIIRSGKETEKSLIRAFSTEIAGSQFLNIQDLSETDKKFVFCKYNISKEKILTLHFIGDTIFKTDPPITSKKLRKFIKKHINDPALFSDDMKFSLRKIND